MLRTVAARARNWLTESAVILLRWMEQDPRVVVPGIVVVGLLDRQDWMEAATHDGAVDGELGTGQILLDDQLCVGEAAFGQVAPVGKELSGAVHSANQPRGRRFT